MTESQLRAVAASARNHGETKKDKNGYIIGTFQNPNKKRIVVVIVNSKKKPVLLTWKGEKQKKWEGFFYLY